ncbi:MAG: AAA family ATPase [Mycobacteriaceae bacterium]|nr:AAA family ATPase [Mycobacteriaceae bacterium]
MTQDSPLIQALRDAVAAAPDQPAFRLHLARALIRADATVAAVVEITEALRLDPDSPEAQQLMAEALADSESADAPAAPAFDWQHAERQVDGVVGPRFAVPVESGPAADSADEYETDSPTVTLADVGGMDQVKQRLTTAFLAPMRNPELRKLYGKSLRGGLLLYGPPGCGKTFIARAVAGELGAAFLSVGITEVLDMWLGASERNLHDVFQQARRSAPCVLFFDELDALGGRRSHLLHNGMRTTVNQFLHELDSVDYDNEGLFVLGATNCPWDVDAALRRPGRFDRTLLVLPPDAGAREQILRHHLRERPIENIDLRALVARTDGYSGADLAHLCDSAAEQALIDSARSGNIRMIGMADFETALREVRPSVSSWFESARSVVMFANDGGQYDDLADYLKRGKVR